MSACDYTRRESLYKQLDSDSRNVNIFVNFEGSINQRSTTVGVCESQPAELQLFLAETLFFKQSVSSTLNPKIAQIHRGEL